MKRILSLALALVLCLSLLPMTALADTGTFKVTGTYLQTDSRGMLESINKFRTGSEAWYWNDDNTAKIFPEGLGELTWDYDLERIAMERAAELVLSFSHTRPNGRDCFSLTSNGTRSYGENIARGYSTANYAFIGWREDDEGYSGQGHRRNMLGGYTAVGAAGFECNGQKYWVQEFGYSNSGAAKTDPNDNTVTLSIEYSSEEVTSFPCAVTFDPNGGTLDTTQTMYIRTGKSYSENAWFWFLTPTWRFHKFQGWFTAPDGGEQVSDDTVVTEARDHTLYAHWEPDPEDLSYAWLDVGDQEYTGRALTPEVKVWQDGELLTAGTDYTVSYANNQSVGTATVTVTGIGNYTGTATTTFTITDPARTGTETSSPALWVETTAIKLYTGKTARLSFGFTGAEAGDAVISTGWESEGRPGPSLREVTDEYAVIGGDGPGTGTLRLSLLAWGTGKVLDEKTVTVTVVDRSQSIAKAKVTLSKTSYAYTGKAKKPVPTVKLDGVKLTKGTDYTVTYKNNKKVGTATVVVKGKGDYTGTVKATFQINPKAPTLSSVKNTAAKKATVKWKKVAGVTGYQIQYSTSKKFTAKTTKTVTVKGAAKVSKALTKLTKGKTYYVRVRTYQQVTGTKYYSAWSAVKTVKIKK